MSVSPINFASGQRIAVIGGGISGLSVGYLLGQKHEITLYESESREGLGVRSMQIKDKNNETHWLDIPLRVCRENYYTNICKMYKYLGAETDKVCVSQTIMTSCKSVIFSMGTAILNIRQFLPMFTNYRHWKTAYHCIKFLVLTKFHLYVMPDRLKSMTFGEYLDIYVNRDFFEEYVYPSCNIILSCSRSGVEGYPAFIVLKVLIATSQPGGRSIMKLSGGINTIIPHMVAPIRNLKFNTKISRVEHRDNQVYVTDNNNETIAYDQVVFATEAECIPYIVPNMLSTDQDIFRYFKYEAVQIVIHSNTEHSLAACKSYWSLLNIINSSDKQTLPQISLLMNSFIHAPLSEYFIQTLNPSPELLKHAIIINQTRMKRVIFDIHVQENLTHLESIQGKDRMWFCGSYAVYGSNLLEEGLISAMHIAKLMQIEVPWETQQQQQDKKKKRV
jgi:predicted NAD/FAD-binding protein